MEHPYKPDCLIGLHGRHFGNNGHIGGTHRPVGHAKAWLTPGFEGVQNLSGQVACPQVISGLYPSLGEEIHEGNRRPVPV